MHEHSLLEGLIGQIETIARQNDANQVVGVTVMLGALSNISPAHFREHFVRAVVGTVAEGAKLEVQALTDMSDPRAQEIVLASVEVPDE